MAKKGKGPPPLIPIDGKRKKKKVVAPEWKPEPPLPDILLPEKLAAQAVTTRSLQKGTYQRKLLAYFAPVLMPELFNSIRRNLHISDQQTQKLAAEIFGLTQTSKGVNILVNQSNNNEAKSASVSRGDGGPTTPDEMFRQLADEREKRRLSKGQVEFVATPGGYEPVKQIEGE